MNRIAQIINSAQLEDNDALVIFNEVNVTYLSGFTGHAATLLITKHATVLITDYRYVEQAEAEVDGIKVLCRYRQEHSLGELLDIVLNEHNIKQLYFESDHISAHQWQVLAAELSVQKTIPSVGLTESLRYTKTPQEVDLIRQAAHIADDALAMVLNDIREGVTERELTTELEYQMAKLGSQEISFQTILLFGARAAMPHGVPGNRRLCHGDFILIDFGAVVQGYHSDMTRTYVFGKADEKQKMVYDTVLKAQLAAIEAVEVGVSGEFVHQQAENILCQSPFAEYRSKGLGHGLGMDVHEQPFMMPGCDQKLDNGYVVTIEPGIYIPGWGGVRIEDDVALLDNQLHILNKTAKDQFEL